MHTLLSITDLHTSFEGQGGVTHAVNGVSLSIETGQTVALVGESGSGKSMTALSVIRLVPPPGRITSGSIKLQGSNLLELSDEMTSNLARLMGTIPTTVQPARPS